MCPSTKSHGERAITAAKARSSNITSEVSHIMESSETITARRPLQIRWREGCRCRGTSYNQYLSRSFAWEGAPAEAKSNNLFQTFNQTSKVRGNCGIVQEFWPRGLPRTSLKFEFPVCTSMLIRGSLMCRGGKGSRRREHG